MVQPFKYLNKKPKFKDNSSCICDMANSFGKSFDEKHTRLYIYIYIYIDQVKNP